MEIYNELKDWIKNIATTIEKNKVVVLLNGYTDGYVSSAMSIDIFEKDNVFNVGIPCYSSPEYMLETVSFSKEYKIKHKIIGIKHVYDSILDLDNDSDSVNDKIINHLRGSIIDAVAFDTDSMILGFFGDHDKKFRIRYLDDEDMFKYYMVDFEKEFSHDLLLELASFLEIDEKYLS